MPIYLARMGGDGPVKIGCTTNIAVRIDAIQRVLWDDLNLFRMLAGSFADEKALHARFAHLALKREWFTWSDEMLGDLDLPDITRDPSQTLFEARGDGLDDRSDRSQSIRAWMVSRGLSAHDLAELTGSKPETVVGWIRYGSVPRLRVRHILWELSNGSLTDFDPSVKREYNGPIKPLSPPIKVTHRTPGPERDAEWRRLRAQRRTLQDIGAAYGVSRERVRQDGERLMPSILSPSAGTLPAGASLRTAGVARSVVSSRTNCRPVSDAGRPFGRKPLAIDLYAGLGGWTDGLLAEGYDVVGFDIERHEYGEHRYPAQLVIQDVLTLHGSQFRDAALIVASPPCQAYSYRAMPWSRAKALPPPCNKLFEACFRIQREAVEAAGRHIPLVVENVRGAQPWVGRARWSFGSFYLWGDVPALMPHTFKGVKHDGSGWRENGTLKSCNQMVPDGIKCGGDWFNDKQPSISRMTSSKSPARKAASALIAKIPLPLSRHIAAVYRP